MLPALSVAPSMLQFAARNQPSPPARHSSQPATMDKMGNQPIKNWQSKLDSPPVRGMPFAVSRSIPTDTIFNHL